MSDFELIKKHKLSKLSIPELEAVTSEIAAFIEHKKQDEAKAAREEIEKMLAARGLSAEQVFGLNPARTAKQFKTSTKATKSKKKNISGRGAAPVAPKYINPNNLNETWSKGRVKNWVKAICEERGITKEDFMASTEFLNPEHPNYDEFVKAAENK